VTIKSLFEAKMSIEYIIDSERGIEISPDELRDKGLVGRIMWDIMLCDVRACTNKKAYLFLLEETAKEIIERVEQAMKGKKP